VGKEGREEGRKEEIKKPSKIMKFSGHASYVKNCNSRYMTTAR
jgi:hypothetical protein